jgi:Rad3-related DNA helicase
MISLITEIKFDNKTNENIKSNKIIPLKENPIYVLFKLFLDSPKFLEEIEEESYLFDIEETVKMFEDFFDETYLTFNDQDNNLLVNVITTNLAKKFKEMVDKNEVIVLMSGTLHSENVLKNVFGIEAFIKIDAEIQQQGNIEVKKTGFEIDCKYQNFSNGNHTREQYLLALSKSIEISKKPTLVHIHAFSDLPTEEEIKRFNINNLISKSELRELQNNDKEGLVVENFKKGKIDVLFTTKCARGIDFPGNECNSIVFTKYPNPNIQDDFWRILKQTKPQYYWDFYKDKAKRELLQKIYRGLRSKEDHIYLLSPDARVLDFFEQ